jgi:predicted nucleic acid-binding protein
MGVAQPTRIGQSPRYTMKIADALIGVDSVLLDTAPAIYLLEKHPAFYPVVEEFFRVRAEKGVVVVTTPITLAECLIHPFRQGRNDLVSAFRNLITGGTGTWFQPIGDETGQTAARVRAKYGLVLGDAIQVAIALQMNCQAILTNDAAIARVTEIRTLLVSNLVK